MSINLPNKGLVVDGYPRNIRTSVPLGGIAVSASSEEFPVPVQLVGMGTGTVTVVDWLSGESKVVTYASDGTGLAPGQPLPFAVRKMTAKTVDTVYACYD